MSIRHRAIVRGHQTVTVMTRPTPTPVRHEILVAPVYVGLCGTDIQILRGLRDDPSPVIGHEGIARVVAAGSDVPQELAVGTLVCINPTHRYNPSFLLGHNVEGLFQERVLICRTAVCDGLVIPVCEDFNGPITTLLEPLAAVHYGLSLLAEHCPSHLVVFGDGVTGHLAVRSACEFVGSARRIIHVHHTKAGMAWSRQHKVPAVQCMLNDATGAKLLSSLPADESVAVLIATPRDATLFCLENALENLQGELTIDLLGGLPADTSSTMLPGVDFNSVRAANCAGSPTPAIRFDVSTARGKKIWLFGHRGVAHKHLRSAATELIKNPECYRSLVTHVVNIDEAAAVMRQLIHSGERNIGGQRLIKLAVRITSEKSSQGGNE